jgi:hypothetical protein
MITPRRGEYVIRYEDAKDRIRRPGDLISFRLCDDDDDDDDDDETDTCGSMQRAGCGMRACGHAGMRAL